MEDDPPVALLLHLMEDKGSFRTFSLGCRPLKLSKLNDLGVEISSGLPGLLFLYQGLFGNGHE